jgi:hypothetical protein
MCRQNAWGGIHARGEHLRRDASATSRLPRPPHAHDGFRRCQEYQRERYEWQDDGERDLRGNQQCVNTWAADSDGHCHGRNETDHPCDKPAQEWLCACVRGSL